MNSNVKSSVLVFFMLTAMLVTALADNDSKADALSPVMLNEHPGVIYISPDGPDEHGSFGRNTPGTKTCGIQEALNYATSLRKFPHAEKHIYFRSGFYYTTETIKIPWMGERTIIDARQTHIAYEGESGDAIIIDSQMNARFDFGYVSALRAKKDWIIRLKPEDPGPSRDSHLLTITPVITCCIFNFNAIVSRGRYDPDKPESMNQRSNGILLDGSDGPIIWNEIFVSELNTCDVGAYVKENCGANRINVPFAHGCNTHLQIGDVEQTMSPHDNRFYMTITSENVPDSTGVKIFGRRNNLDLTIHLTAPEKNLIFESSAEENRVYATRLPNGFTNKALKATNRLILNNPNELNLQTPPFPGSGEKIVNRNPFNVEIMILNPGAVSGWKLIKAGGEEISVEAGLFVGQSLRLNPGDAVVFYYTSGPTWTWRVLQ